MRKKVKTLFPALLALTLLAGLGAAQIPEDIEIRPGIVSSNSPLYPADVAIDNILVQTGVTGPGDVVHERASEMLQAQERNQTQAMERARNQLNRVAQAATNESTAGLQKAEAVLEVVQERNGDNGIGTALENVRQAQERAPVDTPVTGN